MNPSRPPSPTQSLLLRWLSWPFRALASLQLAVPLIAVYAGVLAWATVVESRYGTPAVHFAIYDAGWFFALNALLALNVLCAALVRVPWKRRQTGFLVTHSGILVLLAGCLATLLGGIEAQLPVFEGKASHRAITDQSHFELRVAENDASRAAANGEPIRVPFAAGPFSWHKYRELPWFPWRLARRSQGVIYDEDGISLDVLDYTNDPQPRVRVRLTVDEKAEEFELTAPPDDPPRGDQQHVVRSARRRVAIALPSDGIELGFQLYLHKFQRKLDPGSGMASHYSSTVDFLDRGDPPNRLYENVLITLNAPVDFADPQTGRTYRLFQSSFSGPWKPGNPEFDQLAGSDRSRDQIYLSRLSVNYDPGRGLKYAGSLLLVAGITVVFYMRAYFRRNGADEQQ
jgi:hypothetical protein